MLTPHAATTNPGKLREFATSAATSNIAVAPLPHLATLPAPEETASTFQGNADIKALAYSLTTPGLLVFADDSGLEVDALQGAPGVRSARFAEDARWAAGSGRNIDDRKNEYLLQCLSAEGASAPRTARFVCALTLARDGQILLRAHGTLEGEILHTPRGANGFGYDPLFLIPSLHLTAAELSPEQKWSLSHRGNAFRSLLADLSGIA